MDKAELPHHNVLPPLKAEPHNLEQHLPGTIELGLGTNLQPDLTEEHAHPGVQCQDLPPHVHPLPKFDSKHKHQKTEQNPETPPASPMALSEDPQ